MPSCRSAAPIGFACGTIADDTRAVRLQGRYFEPRSYQRGAILHRAQTKSRGVCTQDLYALAIIADFESDKLGFDIERDLDGVGVRVFEGVRECFLRNSVEMIGRRGTQAE